MPNELAKQPDETPAPYGRWPDGTPITQIEASAKQMNDWASRHGFSGSVRMGIGTQHEEPKRWHEVEINRGKTLPSPPVIESLPPPAETLPAELSSPPKLSWFARLMNWFKGDR